MDIYRQIMELELELAGVADLDELEQIARELEQLRAQVRANAEEP